MSERVFGYYEGRPVTDPHEYMRLAKESGYVGLRAHIQAYDNYFGSKPRPAPRAKEPTHCASCGAPLTASVLCTRSSRYVCAYCLSPTGAAASSGLGAMYGVKAVRPEQLCRTTITTL